MLCTLLTSLPTHPDAASTVVGSRSSWGWGRSFGCTGPRTSVAEVRGVHVPVRVGVGRGHVIGERGADGDLGALEYVVEPRSFAKDVLGLALLERDGVGRETVVADVAQVPRCSLKLGDDQTAVRETIDELVEAQRQLVLVLRVARPR